MRSIDGGVRFSVWDDWELLEEYDVNNARTAAYLQGAHGVIKSLLNNIYYYQDKLGSTTHIADGSGNLLESYRYDLYGTPSYFNSTSQPLNSSTFGIVDLYAGERWIPELGMYDLRNRFMSPELGRFLQADPIGFKGDASNLYRYCHNDPEDFSDPMGLVDSSGLGPYSPLTSFGGGDWIKGSDGLSASDWNHKQDQPAGNITLELVPAGDRNQHSVERKNSEGKRMSGETVPDFKVLDPVRQKDGSWKVTGLYIVDVYYMDAPGSKAGPKTMEHTYKYEWEHAYDMDTKFYRPALKTVEQMNKQLKFASPEAAATAMEKQLRGRFLDEKAATRWRDNQFIKGNHNSPFDYEK
jgi:RHS repeat-associated protein